MLQRKRGYLFAGHEFLCCLDKTGFKSYYYMIVEEMLYGGYRVAIFNQTREDGLE